MGIIDVGEGAGGFGDARGDLDGEALVGAIADQRVEQRLRARVAVDVDEMAEAGEALTAIVRSAGS